MSLTDELNETDDRLLELIERADELPEGDERIALLEEAVRLADATADIKLAYNTRELFIHACVFGGAQEKAVVAFSWCLAQFDKRPELFSEWTLLWKYKWIVNSIYDFPQVSKAQVYAMLDDVARRFQSAGYGLRVVHHYRYLFEKFLGNREEAVRQFRLAEEIPRDALSNCAACELDDHVGFSIYMGDDAGALRLARPLLEGEMRCATVPHRTLATVLLPLVRLGRLQTAVEHHLHGYRLVRDNKNFLDEIGDHIIFLVLTDNSWKAVKLFGEHYVWTEKNADMLRRFYFFRAAWFLFEVLLENGKGVLRVRLPESFPLHSASGRYETAQLAEHFKRLAYDIGAKFDRRNESNSFAELLAETLALKQLRTTYPLNES